MAAQYTAAQPRSHDMYSSIAFDIYNLRKVTMGAIFERMFLLIVEQNCYKVLCCLK
jgi:hypothetical protein